VLARLSAPERWLLDFRVCATQQANHLRGEDQSWSSANDVRHQNCSSGAPDRAMTTVGPLLLLRLFIVAQPTIHVFQGCT